MVGEKVCASSADGAQRGTVGMPGDSEKGAGDAEGAVALVTGYVPQPYGLVVAGGGDQSAVG